MNPIHIVHVHRFAMLHVAYILFYLQSNLKLFMQNEIKVIFNLLLIINANSEVQ